MPILEGGLSLALGVYLLLVASGRVRSSSDREKNEIHRKKHGALLSFGGVLLILLGLVHLWRQFG